MKNSALYIVPAALLAAASCTEILNIDVHYLSGGGGSGAGVTSDGGNGASVTDGGGGSDPSGVGGAGLQGGNGSGGENTGGSSPYCSSADEFNTGNAPSSACWYTAKANLATTPVSSGELHIRPNGAGSSTGWYDSDTGYYLYRHLGPGAFAVVTKVRVTSKTGDGPPTASGGNQYHVAGLIVRDPLAGSEHWLKLEAGYRENSAAYQNHPFGTLAAVTTGADTEHVLPYDDDQDIEVELAICRDFANGMILFVRNDPTGDFVQEDGPQLDGFQITDGVEVGVSATAFIGPQSDIDGRFDWVRFAETPVIESVADCQAIVTDLANQSADGGCDCTTPDATL